MRGWAAGRRWTVLTLVVAMVLRRVLGEVWHEAWDGGALCGVGACEPLAKPQAWRQSKAAGTTQAVSCATQLMKTKGYRSNAIGSGVPDQHRVLVLMLASW